MRVEHAHSGVSVEELLANHVEGLRNRRGAPAWAFFPEKLSHAIDGAEGKDQGARYQVCVACHGQGLAPEDAALACGSRHSGVFRHHWHVYCGRCLDDDGNPSWCVLCRTWEGRGAGKTCTCGPAPLVCDLCSGAFGGLVG